MGRGRLAIVVFSLASTWSLLCSDLSAAAVARKPIDYDALERAWEADDADEELRSEGDEQFRRLADSDEADAKALGPQMFFVTLDDRRLGESLADIATRWKDMLWLGGVEVNIYEMGESKLLVGLQKGLFVDDLRRFLEQEPIIKEYEWNSNTYRTGSTQHGQRHSKPKAKVRQSTSKQGDKSKKKTKTKKKKATTPGKRVKSASTLKTDL